MEPNELKAIVENLLLAADRPVTVDLLYQTLFNEADKAELANILEELREDYRARNLQVVEVAGGYQLCTRPDYSEWVRKFLKLDKTFKLSQPALDTLSIIAYKQPLTRIEVEEIRGVDCSGVMKTLLEKKIIGPAGRKEVPGKPIMYRTTQKFLEYFGLRDLSELPTLEDFGEDLEEAVHPAQAELFPGPDGTPPDDAGEDPAKSAMTNVSSGTAATDTE